MQIQLSNYPVVIEPTVRTLEVSTGPATDPTQWTHLYRIEGQGATAELINASKNAIHFFGTSANIADVQFALCYSTGGRLTGVLMRTSAGWEQADIPPEALGDAVSMPSIRLVFKTERARAGMLHYLNGVLSGKVTNPSLAVVLDQLATPPIVIDVWQESTGG